MDRLQTVVINESSVTHYTTTGKKYVVVVGGGMSAERDVSLMSSKDVIEALIASGYKVTFVDMGIDIASVLQRLKPDLVYNHLHGTFGEDGCIQGILNVLRIPYTHSNLLASALAFSKSQSKALFIANNILSAKSIIVRNNYNIKTDPLPRPYVIKPISQGSSIGVQIIMNEDNFNFADYDFPYGDEVIIEEYIKGREMQVAILNGRALGVLEIKLLENKRFYDYEAKYNKGFTEHILPAVLSEELCNRLLQTSERVYNIMGCKGLARVEFIYNEEIDDFYILELNTHPGMTALSICPEIANSVGIDFKSLVEEIVQTAGFDT